MVKGGICHIHELFSNRSCKTNLKITSEAVTLSFHVFHA